MTIHIDYDREENEIESILASQTKMIRTLIQYTSLKSSPTSKRLHILKILEEKSRKNCTRISSRFKELKLFYELLECSAKFNRLKAITYISKVCSKLTFDLGINGVNKEKRALIVSAMTIIFFLDFLQRSAFKINFRTVPG